MEKTNTQFNDLFDSMFDKTVRDFKPENYTSSLDVVNECRQIGACLGVFTDKEDNCTGDLYKEVVAIFHDIAQIQVLPDTCDEVANARIASTGIAYGILSGLASYDAHTNKKK